MKLGKYKADVREIIDCKQHEGGSIRDYFKRFNEAMLDVLGQSDHLATGTFAHRILSGTLLKKLLGKITTTRQEMNERVQQYLRQQEGIKAKKAYLKVETTQKGSMRDNHTNNQPDRGYGNRKGRFH